MHALLLSPSLSDNVLGRAYSLWLTFRAAGHTVTVAGPADGGRLWEPLRTTAFAEDCRITAKRTHRAIYGLAESADIVVSLKAWPNSLGLGMEIRERLGLPLLVDIDDADAEIIGEQLATHPLRTRWRLRDRTLRPGRLARVRERLGDEVVACSNPSLARLYSTQHVLPHVREPVAPEPPSSGPSFHVAFVGTPREHKGVELLRQAVAQMRDGITLSITASPPADARPCENWLGEIPFSRAKALISASDVVAIPSVNSTAGRYQLPVKLIDAMSAAKPILASDLPPIRWATEGIPPLVVPGDLKDIKRHLNDLRDPDTRTRIGQKLHGVFLRRFTPSALMPALRTLLQDLD